MATSAESADAKKDEAKAALERELEAEREGRLEERFIWIVICVVLIDVLWFRNAKNVALPVVILILQAVILFIIAKRMGIEEVKVLFERMIQTLTAKGGGGGD